MLSCTETIVSQLQGFVMRLTPRSLNALHGKINAANAEALSRMGRADIVLEDLRPARELIPALADPKRKLVLISGPPVTWKNMGNAQKGAVAGICIFEVSDSEADAGKEAASDLLTRHCAGMGPDSRRGLCTVRLGQGRV